MAGSGRSGYRYLRTNGLPIGALIHVFPDFGHIIDVSTRARYKLNRHLRLQSNGTVRRLDTPMLRHIWIGALVFWMASLSAHADTVYTWPRTTRNLQTSFLRRYYPDTLRWTAPAISFSMILLLAFQMTLSSSHPLTLQVVTAAISELNSRQVSRPTLVKH